MYKKFLYFLSLFGILLFANWSLAEIHYYIKHSGSKISVRAVFDKYNKDDKVRLWVPSKIWGADYSRQIKNIKVRDGSYDKKKSSVTLNKDTHLQIDYEVINIPKNQFIEAFSDKYYHFFDQQKFYIMGLGFFVYPEHLEEGSNRKIVINIDSSAKKIIYTVPPYFYKDSIQISLNDLSRILILGNEDFYSDHNEAENIQIIAWSSDKILGKRISNIASKVLTRHQAFWEDYNNIHHLAVLIPEPFISTKNRWGATVIKNTIIGFINPLKNEDEELYNLFNHEGLHFWFGGNLMNGPPWFKEGFADYYMDKINYHYSSNAKEFIDNYNKKLSMYCSSPFHNIDQETIEENFFKIQIMEKLSYLKGYVIAGQLDSIIDLDVVLKAMFQDCRQDKTKCEFSKDLLFSYLDNITAEQINAISKFFKPFDNKDLTQYFLQKFPLSYKKIDNLKYDLDIEEIIKNGFVIGVYLNNLDKKYNKDQNYKLSNINRDDQNHLHFFIENDGMSQEFFPQTMPESIKIPIYNFSN
jgi:predicted metalloprotease with PDZ domain